MTTASEAVSRQLTLRYEVEEKLEICLSPASESNPKAHSWVFAVRLRASSSLRCNGSITVSALTYSPVRWASRPGVHVAENDMNPYTCRKFQKRRTCFVETTSPGAGWCAPVLLIFWTTCPLNFCVVSLRSLLCAGGLLGVLQQIALPAQRRPGPGHRPGFVPAVHGRVFHCVFPSGRFPHQRR